MADDQEPWLVELNKEWISCDGCEKGIVEYDFGVIIKDLLLHRCSAADAAKKIDAYYWDRNLDSGPLFKYHPDGVGDVENILYEIVLDMAQRLSYKDARPDDLVRLVIELRKIPPRPVKAWNGDRFIMSNGNFADCLHERSRRAFVGDVSQSKLETSEAQRLFTEWVNISSFIARCIERGLDDTSEAAKYPADELHEGLEKDHPPGPQRNCRVMVAAQYILLAPTVIDNGLVKEMMGTSSGRDKFRIWGTKLAQLEEDEHLSPEVKAAVVEARQKLISFCPGGF